MVDPRRLLELQRGGFVLNQGRVVVFTDGSVLGNGNPCVENRGGIGIYWGNGRWASKLKGSERLPGEQTVNRAEMYAVIRAIEQHPDPQVGLEIRTDSMHVVHCFRLYPQWRARQWRKKERGTKILSDLDLVKRLVRIVDSLTCKVVFVKVRGHSGIGGNEIAHNRAQAGARMPPVQVQCVDCGYLAGPDGCGCNGDEDESEEEDSEEEESEEDDYFEITRVVPSRFQVYCVDCQHGVGPDGCRCEDEEEDRDGYSEDDVSDEVREDVSSDEDASNDEDTGRDKMGARPRGVKRRRGEGFDRAVRRKAD